MLNKISVANPIRILFTGDSITDAFRKPQEINPAYQLGNGFVFLIVSRLAMEEPGRIEVINRGVSGNGVGDLLARWEVDTVTLAPDMISILVGVNETIRAFRGEVSMTESEFEDTSRKMITLASRGGTRVVVLEPFLLEVGEVTPAWRSHLGVRQEILADVCRESAVPFIRTQQVFDGLLAQAPAEYWAYDGIHPTAAGCAALASIWWENVLPMVLSK